MCGIAAILTSHQEDRCIAARAMSDAMVHRGPDDSGLEVLHAAPGASVILAHRRLSILDLSQAGHQPMHDPETGNWIVYNGEIYNFADLRSELEAAGQRFSSHCDTEVILRGYGAWGVEVLQRLRGMFAFVIHDAARKVLLLARDRLGIKPLYYSMRPADGVTMICASEVRALLASGLIPRRLSPAGVACYLANGYVPDPLTIVDQVQSLLPGWHMIVDTDGRVLEHKAFWKRSGREREHELQPRAEAIHRVRSVLAETVAGHMISDVPLGAFLSGGVDSSTIVALMAGSAGHPIQTFSLTFEDPTLNEDRFARAIAGRFRTIHHEARIDEQEYLSLVPEGLSAVDQPTTDGINSYIVSRKCREAGLKVAVAGTGGDELFGGYTSFRRVPRALLALCAYHRLPRRAREPVGRLLRWVLTGADGGLPSAGMRGKIAALFELPPDPLAVFLLSRWVLMPQICRALRGDGEPASCSRGIPQALEHAIRSVTDTLPDLREQISIFEQTCYLSNQLLRDTDAVSMAVSLEVRVPFLDHVLVETVSRISPGARFGGQRPKQLLIDAVHDLLPPEVYRRKKQGFVLPMGRWLRGPLAPVVSDVLRDSHLLARIGLAPDMVRIVQDDCQQAGDRVFFTRLWSLVVLADWCRRYQVYAGY
jgi:asparagine synthase (glutamine-hydrolysing)